LLQHSLESNPIEVVWESLAQFLAALDAHVTHTEQQIRQHVKQHPALKADCELLSWIPEIGVATAARLLAEMQQLRRFGSARRAAYAGLTPRRQESGTSLRGPGRLSKVGNARVRKALYLPALMALRFNPLIGKMGQRLRQRGKKEMVIVGAVMRKLMHLSYGVLKTGKPFDQMHAQAA
jgi:transposase